LVFCERIGEKGRENLLNIYIVGEKRQEEGTKGQRDKGRREKGEGKERREERGKRKEERKIKGAKTDPLPA
jgi:hypothetical protein